MKLIYAILAICLFLVGCKSHTIENIDIKIDPAYLNADFKQITSNIEGRVPNPYYLCSKVSYDSVKKNISSSLNSSMTVIEFYQKMAPIFSLLKDGHFQFFIDEKLVDKLERENPDLYFPFTVFIDGNKIFVNKNLTDNTGIKSGDEILSINEVSSRMILNRLRYGVSLKTNEENYFERRHESHFYRSILLDMGFRNSFKVKFKDKTVKVRGISAKKIKMINEPPNDFVYKILNGKTKIGYLQVNTLLSSKRQKLDSCLTVFFKLLEQEKINKLIIDIRNNLGGSTKLSRDIFDYITQKKYLIDLGDEYLKDSKPTFDNDTTLSVPRQMPDKFYGKTILLTNVISYSSAHMMANTFKYYKMGIVIGQVSVEPLFISGEVEELITVNTKSNVYFPTSDFYLPGYKKDNISYFVPDYQVYPTINDRIKSKDEALNFAVKLLGLN